MIAPIPAGLLKGCGLGRPTTGGEVPGAGRDEFLIHVGPLRAVFAQDPPVVPVVAGVDVGEVFGFGGGPAQDGFTVDGPDEDLPGTGTTFEDDRLADGTYYYTAFAVDTNGNWSEAATASARARYLTRAPP